MRYDVAIRIARIRSGYTQKQLAEKMDCAQSLISMLESKQRNATTETIEEISTAMGISPLVIYLLAVDATDTPKGKAGTLFLEKITSLLNDLW